MTTWVDVPEGSPFPLQNLPYGIFSTAGEAARAGIAIGDHVLDLAPSLGEDVFARPSLNAFLRRGPAEWTRTRRRITELLTDPARRARTEPFLVPAAEATLHLPIEVADYVDFYASFHHADNFGRMLRPGQDPLPRSWRHLPIGYHGRAGTVVVSGTPISRPSGQTGPGVYGPTRNLDIEAEIGFVVGVPSTPGRPIDIKNARDHLFGVLLVNDWSARDLQQWESRPLGPFLSKSFATSVSPWIVPLEALDAARVSPPTQDPAPHPYLTDQDPWTLDLTLEIRLNGHLVATPRYRHQYWTPAQMLAHLTSNGAHVRTGDLFASGTVSGPRRDERGSLMELSWNGTEPVVLADGQRTFLEDGDSVTITATAPGAQGVRIGFGSVTGTVRPCADRRSETR